MVKKSRITLVTADDTMALITLTSLVIRLMSTPVRSRWKKARGRSWIFS